MEPITKQEINTVVTALKEEIKEHSSASVSDALIKIRKYPNEDADFDEIQKVIGAICASGEYISTLGSDNHVRKNPDYAKKRYFENHPTQEKVLIAIISSAIVLIGTCISETKKQRSQNQLDNKQDSAIFHESERLSTVQEYLKDSVVHRSEIPRLKNLR